MVGCSENILVVHYRWWFSSGYPALSQFHFLTAQVPVDHKANQLLIREEVASWDLRTKQLSAPTAEPSSPSVLRSKNCLPPGATRMSQSAVFHAVRRGKHGGTPVMVSATVRTGRCTPLYVPSAVRKLKFRLNLGREDRFIVAIATMLLKRAVNAGLALVSWTGAGYSPGILGRKGPLCNGTGSVNTRR